MKQWKQAVLAWLGFVAMTILLYPSVWVGQADFYFNDIVNLNLPQREIAATIWSQGEVPLWNRYSFGGQPLLAAMQAGVLYPLNALYLWIPPETAMNVSNLLHMVLAGGFMFTLIYGIWKRALAAWAGGVVFMTNGFITGHLIHTQMMNAVVWIPLILHGLEQLRRQVRLRYALLIAGALLLQVLAGHPQIVFYTGIMAGIYLISAAFAKSSPKFFAYSIGGLTLGLLGAAMQLLPTVELIRRTFRESVTYDFFATGGLDLHWLLALIDPYRNPMEYSETGKTYLFWEYTGYAGIVATILAAIAVLRYRKDFHVRTFALIGAVGLVVALGDYTHASELAYRIPVVNWFRIPARYVLLFDLAVSVLSAKMLVELLQPFFGRLGHKWTKGRWLAVSLLTLLIVVDNTRYVHMVTQDMVKSHEMTRYPTLPGSPGIPPYIAMMQEDPGRFRIVSFNKDLALDRAGRYRLEALNGYDSLFPEIYEKLVDLQWSWHFLMMPRERADLLNVKYIVARNEAGLGSVQPGLPKVTVDVATSLPIRGIHFAYSSKAIQYGMPSRAPLARVTTVAADGTRTSYEWAQTITFPQPAVIKQVEIVFTEWRGDLNIFYADWLGDGQRLVARQPMQVTLAPPLKEVYRDQTVAVYENQGVYPRHWMAESAEEPQLRMSHATVTEKAYRNRSETMDVVSSGGWLVVGQLYDPGWVAYIDGERTTVQEIGEHLMAVPLLAGAHEVTFRYEPKEWTYGVLISATALVIGMLWAIWAIRSKRW